MAKAHWSRAIVTLGACEEAVKWARTQPDFATAWEKCARGDWMMWLLAATEPGYSARLRLVACAIARTVLHLVPAGEDRPRLAIECAERYARGEATREELADASAAASYAVSYTVSYTVSAAASAAASAVSYDASVAAGAGRYAASAAARAAASYATWAPARAEARAAHACIIRAAIPADSVRLHRAEGGR